VFKVSPHEAKVASCGILVCGLHELGVQCVTIELDCITLVDGSMEI